MMEVGGRVAEIIKR